MKRNHLSNTYGEIILVFVHKQNLVALHFKSKQTYTHSRKLLFLIKILTPILKKFVKKIFSQHFTKKNKKTFHIIFLPKFLGHFSFSEFVGIGMAKTIKYL